MRSWEKDQKKFIDSLESGHYDSRSFLSTIRESVFKKKLSSSSQREISKSLDGRFLGFTSASVSTRKSAAYAASNRALLSVDAALSVGDLKLSWDDPALCLWGKARAEMCSRIHHSHSADSVAVIRRLVESYSFIWPAHDMFGDDAAVARACDERWWRRQARVAKVRVLDQLARDFRVVHALSQSYVSDEAVKLRRSQARRNRAVLEGFQATNEEGESYSLAELSDLSVSNPVNRRHELMTRISGFEQLADNFGHIGLFITLSAPSQFHPMRQIFNKAGRLVRVIDNKNFIHGVTPRDAQAWLSKTWSLIRSKLDREEIQCYGFRVVEPHADGCPHWHQLLFFLPECVDKVKEIFKHYSLRTDADELGAVKYRLKIVNIDKSKGSAAGYIAKYISKSIDGLHVDEDLFGSSGVAAAERICAWSSSWGIRQFQQIGGGGVTVWRELRRLDSAEGVTERARVAADAADWAAYCLIQGHDSPFVKRSLAAIRPAYWYEHNANSGEVIDEVFNKYGEVTGGRLFGLFDVGACVYHLTRVYRWTISRVGKLVERVAQGANQIIDVLDDEEMLDFLRGAGSFSSA